MTTSNRNYSLIVVLLLAAGLRLYQIGQAQFWYDEAFSGLVMRQSFIQFWAALAGDVHPPLWYLVHWPLVALGVEAEWALRLSSAVYSLVSVYLVYRIAERLFADRDTALMAALLMSIIPTQVHYAQEFRMYAWLEMLSLLAVWCLLRSNWVCLGIAITALGYSHHYGWFMAAALGLVALVMYGRVVFAWRPVAAFVLPVLAYMPWAVVLADQMSTVAQGYWIQPVTPGAVVYAVYMLWGGFATPEIWQPVSVLVYVGLVTWPTIRAIQRRPPGWALLLIWAWLPLLLAVTVSVLWRPVLLFRGLIISAPAMVILAAWAMDRLEPGRYVYATTIVVACLMAGLSGFYTYNTMHKSDVLCYIDQVRAATDAPTVLHINDGSMVAWLWYAPDIEQYRIYTQCPEPAGSLAALTRQGLGIEFVATSRPGDYVVWAMGPTSGICEEAFGVSMTGGADLFQMVFNDDYRYAGIWRAR
jgi:uncharacterized membrane protein